MKVITVTRDAVYNQFINGNEEIKEMQFSVHPCRIKSVVEKFVKEHGEENICIYTHNTLALDYFPAEYIYLMEPTGKLVPFKEKFKSELEYLYPGEVLLNMCPDLE